MTDLFIAPLMILYGLVLAALFVFGLNFFYFAYLTIKHRGPDPAAPLLERYPHVTVQLPIFNERFVARRAIEAAAALDWPRDRLQIQVLDDSTDETFGMIAAAVRRYREQGLDIEHLHRAEREGYKAGALKAAMPQARGEFLAIFDADFLPARDFLRRTIPHFAEARVGFVQTRWGHLNETFSLFTRLQALAIDGHFMVEQFARSRRGLLLNFNGTAGVWRRAAIADAGGWQADTITEDLDLSYRAQLRGWRGVYLRDTITMGELPLTVNAYRRQQYRWARGSIETARKLLPRVLRSKLPARLKLQAVLHLTGYGIHALMFILALLYPLIAVLAPARPYLVRLFGLAALFNLTALAPTLYFALAQREQGRSVLRRLPGILFLSVLGSGMMVNNLKGILDAFLKRKGVFERTPKYGAVGGSIDGDLRTYAVKLDARLALEGAMLLFNLNTCRLAWQAGQMFTLFYGGIFAAGLAYLLGMTAWQGMLAARPGLRMRLTRSAPLEGRDPA